MPRAHRSAVLALLAAALLIGVLAGAIAAAPPAARTSRLAGISGAGMSGVQVVNLSPTSTMTAVLDLYRQSGAAPIPITRSGIAPYGAGASIYLPAEPSLPNGGYAGILSSDGPHAAIARTDWNNTGAAEMVEGETAADGGFVPLVFKSYEGQTSMVSIQNMLTGSAITVDAEVRASGSPDVIVSYRMNIAPGTSTTLDLAKNPGFRSLPEGFVGTMHVAPTLWDGPGWPLAVNAIVDVETSPRAVYAFGGDVGDAQAVFVPRFRLEDPALGAAAPSKHTTLLAVANPGAAAGDFRLIYTGLGGGCAGQVIVHGNRTFTIPAGSNLLFDQGPSGAALATGASGLPAGCFGTAKVEVVREVVRDPNAPGARVAAVVVDFQRGQLDPTDPAQVLAAGAYNAFAASDAATTVHSPLFRNQHVGLSTEVTAMNLGAAPAQVELSIRKFSDGLPVTGCGDACRAAVAPGASFTFRPDALPGLTNGLLGSATLTSDQPIVAIVDDVSIDGTRDTSTFRAIRIAGPPDGADLRHSALPLLLQRTGGNPTTPSPVPTLDGPGVTVFAIGFVDVAGGGDPSCPGCDGDYSVEDENYATQHSLPPMTFVVRDSAGNEIARRVSDQLATLQRAMIEVPPLADGAFYTLELLEDPAGWHLCGNEPRSRRLVPEDFMLDSVREDFHFHQSTCVPVRPPTPTPRPTHTPDPNVTPTPVPTPFPPGVQPLTIFAIGFVDVAGGGDPSCPGCDGDYSVEDENYATQHPLPSMTFVVRDSAGNEIARRVSDQLATLQRVLIEVPPLADGAFYTLELLEDPAGWRLCGNESRIRRIDLDDFQLGATREDFHFNTNQCRPWPTATAPSQTTTRSFSPSDDSLTSSDSPDSNYGDADYLRVRKEDGDDYRAYLRFEVDDLEGPVISAKLRLRAIDGGDDRGAAHLVAVNWTEDAITWNNAPALGARLGTTGGQVDQNTWVEYNVTGVMHPGDGTYAFAIEGNSTNSLVFRSKEASLDPPELVIVTAAKVQPTATSAPPAAGPKGAADTGVSLINLDSQSSPEIQLAMRPQGGGDPEVLSLFVPAGTWAGSLYLPQETRLGRGAYAGLASADVPIAAIANTYWPEQRASAYSEDAVPAADLVVPLVVKGAGGQNSLVTIQNYDAQSATEVEIELHDTAGEVAATAVRSIAAGSSITLDIGRDPAFQGVPLGFVGTLRAKAALRIAAQALVDVEHSPMAVYGFQGEPAVAASGTLFIPRALAGVPVDPEKPQAGLRMTRIAAANPGTSAVAVTLTFTGGEGTCGGDGQPALAPIGPASIAAGGMRLFDLPAEGLPAGCATAVRLSSTGGGVLAVAVDSVEAGRHVRAAGAYNAFSSAQAGTRTILPMVRKRMLDGRQSTDITVMNVSSSPAAISLSIREFALGNPGHSDPIDCPADCGVTVAPGASHTFVPEAIEAWPMGEYGLARALVESNQPVVVTVADDSRLLKYDLAIYRGAAATLAPGDLAPRSLALPLMVNRHQVRLDGPALTPPDPGWINLPSLVEPLNTLFLPLVGFLLDEPLHR